MTLAGAGTPFHLAYLAAQRASPGETLLPDGACVPRRRRAEAAAAALRREGGARRRRHRVGLRAHRVPDPGDGDGRRPRREAGGHRGPYDARRRGEGRQARRHGRRSRARRARSGSRARSSAAATSTRRSTPTRSTTTAASAPATSASSTPTATSSITGRLKDVIIRKGENISAKEIEDLLFTHPKVARRRGDRAARRRAGERACAIVVPADPADAADVREHVRVLQGRGADGAEDPRAARDRRRAAAQPDRQGPEARAPQAVHRE